MNKERARSRGYVRYGTTYLLGGLDVKLVSGLVDLVRRRCNVAWWYVDTISFGGGVGNGSDSSFKWINHHGGTRTSIDYGLLLAREEVH